MKKANKDIPWSTQIGRKYATILMLMEEGLEMISIIIFIFLYFPNVICKIKTC